MMKHFFCLICCGLVFLLLTGFDGGIEAEKLKDAQAINTDRVIEYEEPVVPQESNQDLYLQYHLLMVTSLEESSVSLANAYNYNKLIINLLKEEHQDIFIKKNEHINALMLDMDKRNLPNSKIKNRLRI